VTFFRPLISDLARLLPLPIVAILMSSQEQRLEVLREQPGLKVTEVSKVLGQR
jgi:hypothetical protein